MGMAMLGDKISAEQAKSFAASKNLLLHISDLYASRHGRNASTLDVAKAIAEYAD